MNKIERDVATSKWALAVILALLIAIVVKVYVG
jgi:hypothetical protein